MTGHGRFAPYRGHGGGLDAARPSVGAGREHQRLRGRRNRIPWETAHD